ncbi:MAG: dihydroorotate dehydrogenase-like protein [bacterium]
MDLSTNYMGLSLDSPLVASSSPLCEKIDNIRKMEDAGASAVVLHSLFEEQINREGLELDRFLTQGTETYWESISFFPDLGNYKIGPDDYLEHIRKAKNAVKIPIIASLNGVSTGGWISYAKLMEEAGADALELNIYYIPTEINITSQQVEHMYIDLARDIKNSVNIPVAVKLSPYFSSMSYMAGELDKIGIDALVMFNRFYQPDLDIENLNVIPNLSLSTSQELRLRIRWVAILFGRIKADMAITGGVHTAEDALKAMMAGAKVAMMTSALLKNGIEHLSKVKSDMKKWMEEHEYESINQMQGSMSQKSVAEPAAYERANYMKILGSYLM